MAAGERKKLISKLRGSLPRYFKSDDKDDPVVIQTSELVEALAYLEGEK